MYDQFNHKDQRIFKLADKGLTSEIIARKIGQPGPDGIKRVEQALKRREAGAETRGWFKVIAEMGGRGVRRTGATKERAQLGKDSGDAE